MYANGLLLVAVIFCITASDAAQAVERRNTQRKSERERAIVNDVLAAEMLKWKTIKLDSARSGVCGCP